MASVVCAFGLAVLPGVAVFLYQRGPAANVGSPCSPPDVSIPEVAVLRDGTFGATRWAFGALLFRLARDGHCTFIRTHKQRWLTTGLAIVVETHADPTRLSFIEQTILRQLVRHDTLGGFGFAGSTFRRRTLRDVRADLVDRGLLRDRRGTSNTRLAFSLAGLAAAIGLGVSGSGVLAPTIVSGLATGSLLAARVRYPLTQLGAHYRAAHRAYVERTAQRISKLSATAPDQAADLLFENLPSLVLERWATPHRLLALAQRFDAADSIPNGVRWIRSDETESRCVDQSCRDLAAVLSALGIFPPLQYRLRSWLDAALPS